MNQERRIELKVGLLIVVALALLGGLIYKLGDFSVGKGFDLSVDFEFTGNLHVGAPVKVAGLKVGKVTEIRFLAGERRPSDARRAYVRVAIWLEDRVRGRVYEDAEIYINTQGVLGEQYLEIVPGTSQSKPVAPGAVLTGVTPPRVDLIVARLYEFLDRGTKLLRRDRKTISQLLRASSRAISSVDKLLATNEPQIKKLLLNLDQLSGETTQLVKNLRVGLSEPRRIARLVANTERVTASLSKNIDGLLSKADKALEGAVGITSAIGGAEKGQIKRALAKLLKLSDRVYALAGSAGALLSGLRRGKGTAGALLARRELYDDLKEMVRDLKRNPWKFLWRE